MSNSADTVDPAFTTKQALIDEVRRVVEPTNPGEYYSLIMRIIHTDLGSTITAGATVTEASFTF